MVINLIMYDSDRLEDDNTVLREVFRNLTTSPTFYNKNKFIFRTRYYLMLNDFLTFFSYEGILVAVPTCDCKGHLTWKPIQEHCNSSRDLKASHHHHHR